MFHTLQYPANVTFDGLCAFVWFKNMAPKLKRPLAALKRPAVRDAAVKRPAVRDDLSVRWMKQHEGDPLSNNEIIRAEGLGRMLVEL